MAESDDINSWWSQWKDVFFAVVDDVIPQVRWKRKKMKFWLSPSTIKLIRCKCLCYRKMKSDTASYSAKYKNLRNQVRSATRNDYLNHLDSITKNLYCSQKPFWNWIHKIKSCRHPIPSIIHNSELISSDYIKASLFNDYFVSVFTKEDSSNLQNLCHHLPSHPKFHLDNFSVSYSDVVKELSNLNVHKACGPDQICPRLLKEGAEQLSPSLVKIFNKSLDEGVLPLVWVSANITPVYKKGDKHLFVNYRPISLTCILCKVLEKLIHRKLYNLLESHNVLSDVQFGFRSKRSTVSLLLLAVHDWAKSLNDHLSTHCVFIDFAKAFDSVPHARLLAKLQAFGVQGSILQWFCSFLTTCQQRVVINDQHSEWHDVSSGVPQAPFWDPFCSFFTLMIFHLSLNQNLRSLLMMSLCLPQSHAKKDCLSLQADLDAISRWCHLWQMKLHPLKCEVLCISNKRSPPKFDYKINDVLLKWRSSVKYLGVYINSKLSWNDQCSADTTKATRVLNIIRCNLFGCSVSTKSRAGFQGTSAPNT